MVLSLNKDVGHLGVNGAEDDDKDDIDDGWSELEMIWDILSILINICVIPHLHTDLSADYAQDEEDGYGDTDESLAEVRVESRNFVSRSSLLVNQIGCFELFALRCWILEVSQEPHVSNLVLLALPALHEVGCPQDDKDCIERVQWRVKRI